MTLERAIALVFIAVCLAYGYTAFVVMEASILPFERNLAFLPNVLPKWLSVIGVVVGLAVLAQSRAGSRGGRRPRRHRHRKPSPVQPRATILLLALMVAYALLLRPVGFLTTTTLFLGAAP